MTDKYIPLILFVNLEFFFLISQITYCKLLAS